MSDFKARKKMLVTESEVYRELLKLEIRTFKVYGFQRKRRLSSISTYMPFLISGLPIAVRLFRRKKKEAFSLKRLSSLFFVGWKAYQFFAGKTRPRSAESNETAAEEYLSKRL